MGPARKLCMVAWLSTAFLMAAVAGGQTVPVQTQLTQYEQKLAEARAAGRVPDEGIDLIVLGYLCSAEPA